MVSTLKDTLVKITKTKVSVLSNGTYNGSLSLKSEKQEYNN